MLTFTAYWYVDRQTRAAVEERLSSIGRSVATPAYPMSPTVLRAVSELTDTQLILLDNTGQIVDATLNTRSHPMPATPIFAMAADRTYTGIQIDHAFRAPDNKLYHAGWSRFNGAKLPGHSQEIAWVGILMDQFTVRQMRWQALLLPLITGLATAIGLGAIAGWLTDRVVRRLQTVQRKVQRIAAGDYAPIESSGARDELDELIEHVNYMAEELRLMEARIHATERERLIHALAAGLSHDLRNTLTGARLAIQLHSTECHGDTESITVAVRQLRLAEDQLTRWLRLGGGDEVAQASPLRKLLDNAIELVKPMTEHLGSSLNIVREAALESIEFQDAETLSSAVLNLLLNAVQAAGQGGRVGLRTAAALPGWLSIEVSDNGPGPSAEVQAKMFEPLVTTKREGVGLGLALVAKAAKQLAGEIAWHRESEETIFSLQLPITKP